MRELLHYDAAMAIVEERFPPLAPDLPEAEIRVQTQIRMAYHAAVIAGWSDCEHQRRMADIAASLRTSAYQRPTVRPIANRIVIRVAS